MQDGFGAPAELDEVLDDLCSRFLINIPPEETENTIRIMFAVETAHWHYTDFSVEENPLLPALNMKQLLVKMLNNYPPFKHLAKRADQIVEAFNVYKRSIPVFGGIMVNASCDKVVLVKSYGKRGCWGFPKGKVNKDEAPLECAIREVEEETGYSFRPYCGDGKDSILLTPPQVRQPSTLFIAVGVPENTVFETRTRKEIDTIEWHPISKMPQKRSNHTDPFLRKLKEWMRSKRGKAVCKAAMKKAGLKPKDPAGSPAVTGTIPVPIQPGLLPTPGKMSADGGFLNDLLSKLKGVEPLAQPATAAVQPPASTVAPNGGLSLDAWAANILHTPPQPLNTEAVRPKEWEGQAPPKQQTEKVWNHRERRDATRAAIAAGLPPPDFAALIAANVSKAKKETRQLKRERAQAKSETARASAGSTDFKFDVGAIMVHFQ